jgi:hypothetical protein
MQKKKRLVGIRFPGQVGHLSVANVNGDRITWGKTRELNNNMDSDGFKALEDAIKRGDAEIKINYFTYQIEEVKQTGVLEGIGTLFSMFDRTGNFWGGTAAFFVVSCFAAVLYQVWTRFAIPLWLTVISFFLVPVIGLILAWIVSYIVGDMVSRDDPVSRAIRCPKCGAKMKFKSRNEYSDASAGPGKIVRSVSTSSVKVCPKCGHEE